MTYQRTVERELKRRFPDDPGLHIGQWLQFVDGGGTGMAQPDAYLVGPHSVICFEVKLTQRQSALLQIGQLYRPLLREIYKLPVVGVVVCQNLIHAPGKWLIGGPEDVLDNRGEDIFTWHHLR